LRAPSHAGPEIEIVGGTGPNPSHPTSLAGDMGFGTANPQNVWIPRHQSLNTTMVYLHPETEQIKNVIDRRNL
jgi:hypothetical protein